MIFATLELEREPPQWIGLGSYVMYWFQVAGGVAAIALAAWAIHYFAEKQHLRKKKLNLSDGLFVGLCLVAAACYIGFFGSLLLQGPLVLPKPKGSTEPQRYIYTDTQFLLSAVGGIFALLAIALPMFRGLVRRLSLRRIGAIARLSIKEAVRQRVIYGFCLVALVFLFAPYFLSYRDDDQLRNYVKLIHTSMTPLFLVTAAFLGAFSIPNDVQRQTIHTIVTKPVEKYEIVLGRFAGNALLLTAILAVLTLVGLVYLIRGINPRAAQESYKARVPIYAYQLIFQGTEHPEGENVGREIAYRHYIHGRSAGSSAPIQYAIWAFPPLPASLTGRDDPVTIEMALDIFRTTKAREGKPGVLSVLTFAPGYLLIDEDDGKIDPDKVEKKVAAMRKEKADRQEKIESAVKDLKLPPEEAEKQLAEKLRKLDDELVQSYGVYQNAGVNLTDYHTQGVTIPAALARKLSNESLHFASVKGRKIPLPHMVAMVSVNSEDPYSAPQYIGGALHDVYVLDAELPFWQNFCKMMIGLWCNTLLILGIAIACSTYLSGVVSLLVTLFLLGAGAVVEFIRELASSANVGGGPFEAANRLLNRLPGTAPLEKTAAAQLGMGADESFRWVLNYILNLIPDMQRFDLTSYVAEGFNISWGQIIFLDNILPMIGFLIPWAIFAYYLINFREVANPT